MADKNQLEQLLKGPSAWNQWRKQYFYKIDLAGVDLSGLNVCGANLTGVSLSGAQLSGTLLATCDLSMAQLDGACLRKADLGWSDLRQANLRGSDLRETNLRKANFTDADMKGAKIAGAELLDTVFGNTVLRDVVGLSECKHIGASVLDHATLARSGPVSEIFLRGCQLPEELITYLPSLLSEAIHFHSCFISYSTADQKFAERIHADLEDAGVRCWFAPHDIQGGKKIHEQIDLAIHIHDRLLLILSNDSMTSAWVKTEIAKARGREVKEQRRILFPVRLTDFDSLRRWECFDADLGIDSAKEIREYYVPDFSEWQDYAKYKAVFRRLLRDLKA